MNTPARPHAVRILFYCALALALICGAMSAWFVGIEQTGAAVILVVAMLCALTGALILDYSEEEPL